MVDKNLPQVDRNAYEKAFITNNYGYSSAVSMIIFVVLIAFSSISNMKSKAQEV